MTCVFCTHRIPRTRIGPRHPYPRYCSQKCIKQAYYLRKNPEIKSHLKDRRVWRYTETGKGRKWEEFVCNLLGGVIQAYGHPFDIDWNGKTVDVKSANLYKRTNKKGVPVVRKNQSGWFRFDRGEVFKEIDYFFCIGLIEGVPNKMFLIPGNRFGKRGITVSPNKSKYDEFIYPSK